MIVISVKGSFMQFLKQIVTNHYLIAPIIAWALSQILKVFTSIAECKGFDIQQIRRDGGMPSAHSATVVTLMAVVGYEAGFDSVAFAIAFIVGAVIMRDAVGVRRESGKQAEVIKRISEKFELDEAEFGIDKLKLGGGHTVPQVFAGCAVGLVVGISYILIFLR